MGAGVGVGRAGESLAEDFVDAVLVVVAGGEVDSESVLSDSDLRGGDVTDESCPVLGWTTGDAVGVVVTAAGGRAGGR